ncbi:MAG TPA: ABC transporter substrate-binding protein [Casimicrobiaceae bacterium]|jgi:NitT/TauT family transport system substrate-binding protein|nr:ABC transporter substrate-binding protein [Casimicrobiaceae bacterium]
MRIALARAALILVSCVVAGTARAEVSEVRISYGYGVLYLPLMIMDSERLMEKQAKASGLGEIKASYRVLDGGNVINDAMLSGALDIASIGVPGFLTLWAKAKDNPALEIRGLSGLSSSSMYLMTRNPAVKSLKDFTDKDRIAVPGIKTSLPAVLLHMAAAKEFGDANYSKLDPITVSLPHPEALTVMLSGKGEIDSHMASPPFSYVEDATPGLHRVFNSVDVLGNITLDMTYASRRFFEANPKLCAAFIAALNEANLLIAKDSRKAAEIYLTVSKQKATADEIVKILSDPNSKFSTVPQGTMKYAEFMARVGTIKAKPTDWKELFFPSVHAAGGS